MVCQKKGGKCRNEGGTNVAWITRPLHKVLHSTGGSAVHRPFPVMMERMGAMGGRDGLRTRPPVTISTFASG